MRADVIRPQEFLLRREWPGDELVVRRLRALLLDGREEVELLRVLRLALGLHGREGLVERRQRRGIALEVGRRRQQVALEVEELEPRGLADHLLCAVRVDAGELDHHLVVALFTDLRLRHAELVDAPAHDGLGRVHPGRGDLLPLRRHRLEHDFGAALEVEAEHRFLVERRAGNREQSSAEQGREYEAHQDQVRAALGHGCRLRVAAFRALPPLRPRAPCGP
jgi:hypothetical protein